MKNHNCGHADCPENDKKKWPIPKPSNDPRCICNKPLLIYIPPGQHIHCPVHPEHIIRGSQVTL